MYLPIATTKPVVLLILLPTNNPHKRNEHNAEREVRDDSNATQKPSDTASVQHARPPYRWLLAQSELDYFRVKLEAN